MSVLNIAVITAESSVSLDGREKKKECCKMFLPVSGDLIQNEHNLNW
jgi:hypothetical protein